VLTLDARRPRAAAIAVGQGRVLALGSRSALRYLAGARTERVDCHGATVLPGLIDPHLHLFALAARQAHLDCAAPHIETVDDLLAAVAGASRALPPGGWLRGESLDEGCLGRLPTAAELDAASGGRPVRLRHRSRHASVLSATALGRLDARAAVGRVGSASSGLVVGREERLRRLVGPLPEAVLAGGFATAARELAALGVTAVEDATPRSRRALGPLCGAVERGTFPLRVHAMRPLGSRAWAAVGRMRPGAVKLMVEEEPAGLRPRPSTLARRIVGAAAAGAQVAVHCVGAATLVAALAAFAVVPRRHRVGRRHRLEHVAECPPALVPSIAGLGLTVVTNPAFIYWRGDAYRRETDGPARSWLYRARSLAAAGVALAGASDAPVIPPNPWLAMAAARTRETAGGALLGRQERLGAMAALRLFTTGAAYALGDDRLGRLVPGGPADLVLVDPDPLRAPPDEMRTTRVQLVLVEGERVWPA
jgi:predicted amidohydrolase YtcJ